jgi:hypothetical protein
MFSFKSFSIILATVASFTTVTAVPSTSVELVAREALPTLLPLDNVFTIREASPEPIPAPEAAPEPIAAPVAVPQNLTARTEYHYATVPDCLQAAKGALHPIFLEIGEAIDT